ncbi:hypothetical protein [Gloeothece verrucosa]|uniref:Uncharacterized protein n=1 Tax=Gloeothece verrucosa (strain PCC 7822) TaxID=497965 RepID=E0UCB2_GLOV7|nr:hypothetical protein [Gloeothece verrucosa]ADN12869.1 hypothetical protein Cyan7822_0849 [Gloeothece verrucosa PCC 7822]
MLEFLQPGNVTTTKGLFIGIPNLPNSFTEDYLTTQTAAYKNGRFILSVLDKFSELITATDFLSNPNETNKLGVTISEIPIRVDSDTEDRLINIKFIKVLNTLTKSIVTPDIGDPLDESFPTGKFDLNGVFPLAQLLNVGDSVSYAGAVISETVLLASGLSSLSLTVDGLAFLEAFLRGIYNNVPSQSGGITSVILPYARPVVRVEPSSLLNNVVSFFDGVDAITNNIFNVLLSINFSVSIRMKITSDRTTVSTTT